MYRMSLLQMQSLADHSTHLRATCNFPTPGLKITDYARAKLKNHAFFGTFSYQCLHYVRDKARERRYQAIYIPSAVGPRDVYGLIPMFEGFILLIS